MRQYNERELNDIAAQLHHWPITASGTEGYRTAEVTLGGVDTRELSSGSMESKRVPGLYFIGEVVDVTGWLGGYNFQWAWASGHTAGEVAGARSPWSAAGRRGWWGRRSRPRPGEAGRGACGGRGGQEGGT